jgi:hypothetical protein
VGVFFDECYVVNFKKGLWYNSGIDTYILNRDYVGVDKPLNSLPIEFGCGVTWQSFIQDEQIVTFRTTN